jgi:hypothetical protein
VVIFLSRYTHLAQTRTYAKEDWLTWDENRGKTGTDFYQQIEVTSQL